MLRPSQVRRSARARTADSLASAGPQVRPTALADHQQRHDHHAGQDAREHQQPGRPECAARSAAAGGAVRPGCRRPGPGSAISTWTPTPSRAASTVIATVGGRRRRPPPQPAVRRGTPGRARTDRPRQPRQHAAAQHPVAEQARRPARAGRTRPASGPCRDGQRDDEQHGAGEGEPHGARVEQSLRPAACPARSWRASRSRSTRSLSQPRTAWPTSTVAATSPTSRSGRPASPAARRHRRARCASAWRGWAARTSSTGRLWASEEPRRAVGAWVDMRAVSTTSGLRCGRATPGRHRPQRPGAPARLRTPHDPRSVKPRMGL